MVNVQLLKLSYQTAQKGRLLSQKSDAQNTLYKGRELAALTKETLQFTDVL